MSHILKDTEQPNGATAGSLALVTLAGNEYSMPVDIEQYEYLEQLEDDVVNFLLSIVDIPNSAGHPTAVTRSHPRHPEKAQQIPNSCPAMCRGRAQHMALPK